MNITSPPLSHPIDVNDVPSSPKDGVFRRLSRRVERKLRFVFFKLGYFVSGYPWTVIIISLLLACLLSIGSIQFETQKQPERLWVPQDTTALEHKEWLDSNFPSYIRPERVIFTHKSVQDGDIATKEGLLQMIQVLKVSEDTRIGNLTFDSVCDKAIGAQVTYCNVISVLDLFYDQGFVTSPPDFLQTIERKVETLSDSEIKDTLSSPEAFKTWNNKPLKASDVMGSVTGTGPSLTVASFRVLIILQNNLVVQDGIWKDPDADTWESQWIENMNNLDLPGVLQWNSIALSSIFDAMDESINGDMSRVFLGFIFLGLYASLHMGEYHRIRSRIVLASMGFMSVGLAYISALGLSSGIGLFYGPVHQVLPLLLVGIGIDDAFVIVTALDNLDPKISSVREKVAAALSQAGAAITVTSITNSCAFFIGALTHIPALRHFAVWAGIGIVFDFIFKVTFFVACLTLDIERQEKKKLDLVPCVTVKKEIKGTNVFGLKPGVLARAFDGYLSPIIFNRTIRMCILLCAVAGFTTCVYGLTQLKQAFKPEFFYIDGTYTKDYDAVEKKYFGEPELLVDIYTTEIQYNSTDVQREMYTLFAETLPQNPYVQNDTITSWYLSFRQSRGLGATETIDPSQYYAQLAVFLQTNGSQYAADFVFDNSSTKILASKSSVLLIQLESNDEQVDAMFSLRDSIDGAIGFPFTYLFIFFEQYAIVKDEAIMTLVASLIAVLILSILLIGNIPVACIVLTGVGLSVVDVLGMMHFWDINLNSVSVVNLSLAVGLTIDFSAHLGLAFMEAVGTRQERARLAVRNLGPPLFHSGFSTFLAVSVLVVARSYIFRVFFKMFVLIIGLGMFHGLIVVPELLSLLGPRGFFNSHHEKEQEETLIQQKVLGKAESSSQYVSMEDR